MRKIIPCLALAAAMAMTTSAFAEPPEVNPNYTGTEMLAGAAVGTAVGVGLYEGWYTGATAAALPATAVGAAAVGGVAGIGTIALLDAFTQPCRGFGVFVHREGCVNGEWVGDRPVMMQRHVSERHVMPRHRRHMSMR